MPWRSKTPAPSTASCWKAVRTVETYVTRNRAFVPNYGERCRQGKTIATSFVESAVNQVVSRRLVKKAADALDAHRCSPLVSDPLPSLEWGMAFNVGAVVPWAAGHARTPSRIASGFF